MLRRWAAAKLADENPGQTIHATELEREMDFRSTKAGVALMEDEQ